MIPHTETGTENKFRILLAFAAIYIVWGTTYLTVKIGLETIPPFAMASMRYFIAGILLLVYCSIKKESVFAADRIMNFLLGACMLTLGQGLLFWVEKYISSGLTAVFGATLPIWYIVADVKNWKFNFQNKLTLASIGIGFIGILLLFAEPSESPEPQAKGMALIASVAAVASCYCWAVGSLYYTHHKKNGSVFANVGWQLMGGMVCCALISFLSGEGANFSISKISMASALATVYMAIAASIVALIALYWLLDRRPAPVVGTYAYVNPVIAVILGYFIAREKISILQIAAMTLILVAAWMANQVKLKADPIASGSNEPRT